MTPSVIIDCFPESALRYNRGYAIVAVDVIRATTTIATAVSRGWRCFPVPSLEAAWRVSAKLHNPLLMGEVRGVVPEGFEMNNSPAALAHRTDVLSSLDPAFLLGDKTDRAGPSERCSLHWVLAEFRFRGAAGC